MSVCHLIEEPPRSTPIKAETQVLVIDGGWFFKTIGEGKVLLPWGPTERTTRQIDATAPPETGPRPKSNAASG